MPHQFGNSGGDVIYEFVADDQTYTFNACSTTDYDSLLRIYDSNEILVDYNDDHGGSCPSGSPSLSSHLVADSLQMGETYFLVIEGYSNNEGAYVVDVGCEPKPEPQSIQCGDHLEGSTVGMPHQFGNSGGDVIYEFVADDQTYTFNACSTTDYDSLLRIYDSNEILVDYNDDHGGSCPSGSPSLSSHLVADSLQMGETYFLVIEGYSSNEGSYVVDVGCEPNFSESHRPMMDSEPPTDSDTDDGDTGGPVVLDLTGSRDALDSTGGTEPNTVLDPTHADIPRDFDFTFERDRIFPPGDNANALDGSGGTGATGSTGSGIGSPTGGTGGSEDPHVINLGGPPTDTSDSDHGPIVINLGGPPTDTSDSDHGPIVINWGGPPTDTSDSDHGPMNLPSSFSDGTINMGPAPESSSDSGSSHTSNTISALTGLGAAVGHMAVGGGGAVGARPSECTGACSDGGYNGDVESLGDNVSEAESLGENVSEAESLGTDALEGVAEGFNPNAVELAWEAEAAAEEGTVEGIGEGIVEGIGEGIVEIVAEEGVVLALEGAAMLG